MSHPMPPPSQSGNTGGRDDTAGRRQAVQLRLAIEAAPGRPALGSDRSATRIDMNTLHPREVDHQAAVHNGASRDIVPAAANRNFQAKAASKLDGVDDVRDPAALRDQRRPFVHHAVVHPPCGIVAGVGRLKQHA
jgi:hypothetical protein